jgi:heat shock protein HslJ
MRVLVLLALLVCIGSSLALSQEPTPLEQTYWRLTKLGTREPNVPVNAREPHLTFLAGGAIAGADGCNTFRGTYKRAGENALTIGPLMGTLMACPGLERLDREFLDALGATRKWKITAAELTLLDVKDQPVATFQAAAKP